VTPFVVHANLDCEAAWAGAPLPPAVARRVSYYAALQSSNRVSNPAKTSRRQLESRGLAVVSAG